MDRVRKLAPLLFAVLVACTQGPESEIGRPIRIATPMPDVSGESLQARTVSRSDYAGKVVVVNFWATWCGPCRREQPALERLFEQYRGRGVYFLGVDTRDYDSAAVRAWIDEFHVGYPSIQDKAGAYANVFGFVGLPNTYVVDRSGTMRYKIFGELDPEELAAAIDRVLASARN